MASGGMDWAYRMIAAHDLDPLGVAVVLHLGWRDAANLRTDSGIARALRQHRSSIRLATSKLEAAGVICRRSGQWVAVETVEIVTQSPKARRPDPAHSDDGWPVSGHGQSVATPWPVSGQPSGQSVATKRKEKKEKGAGAATARPVQRQPRRLPLESGGSAVAPKDAAVMAVKLSPFQRKQVREGNALVLDGQQVAEGSPLMLTLQAALSDLERGAVMRPCGSPEETAALVAAVAKAGERTVRHVAAS